MEQVYSHHHMAQAHHSGLVIGTLVGSCVVTLFAAVAIVTASPRLVLHPLSFTSEISVQPNTIQSSELGPAVSVTNNQLFNSRSLIGPGIRLSSALN